jgi:hypothetical protein
MFTLKKVALLGTAGLAAFSISCSDGGDEKDPGGVFKEPLAVIQEGSSIFVEGVIKAEGEDKVKSVIIKADGGTTGVTQQQVSTPVAEVDLLTDLHAALVPELLTACSGKGGQQVSVKVEVTASFVDGGDLVESVSKQITCGGSSDPQLVKDNITIGGKGAGTAGSFADIDPNPATINTITEMKNGGATLGAKIDLIWGMNWDSDKIHTLAEYPDDIDTSTDDALADALIAGARSATLYIIPPGNETLLAKINTATKLSEVADLVALAPLLIANTEAIAFEVPATEGSGFLVKTTNGAWRIAVVSSKTGITAINIKTAEIDM